MSLVELQDHEFQPLANLLTTYALNTPNSGMTPNPHSSHRRHPAPAIMPIPPEGRSPNSLNERSGLPWTFECTVFQLPDALLYDGTVDGERLFEEATGLTPKRFAQGWLEVFGCAWRYFHPVKEGKEGCGEVTEAICGYWAAKVKHWRTISAAGAKANLLLKCGEEGYAQIAKLIDGALPEIMCVKGRNEVTIDIVGNLDIIANPDCEAHPWTSVCSCATALDMPIKYEMNLKVYFVDGWIGRLIAEDDAFIYKGALDIQSSTLFKVRMGQTPEEFAEKYIEGTQTNPVWKIRTGCHQALVDGMLAFWAHKAREWRETCKTRREARTKFSENLKEEENMIVISKATGVATRSDPHENDNDHDPLCRYVRVETGKQGHTHTLVLYAKSTGPGDFGYDIVRMVPCHKACGFAPDAQADIKALTAGFSREDMAKAEAVRAEW